MKCDKSTVDLFFSVWFACACEFACVSMSVKVNTVTCIYDLLYIYVVYLLGYTLSIVFTQDTFIQN